MALDSTHKNDKGLFFRLFLGPLSLILSSSLLLLKTPDQFLPITATLLAGSILTALFRIKGFFVSLALLSTLAIYSGTASLWFMGALFTVALSYLITFLTVEELRELFVVDVRPEKDNSFQEETIKSLEQLNELSRLELLSSQSKLEELEGRFAEELNVKTKLDLEVKGLQESVLKNEREKALEKAKGEELIQLVDRLHREKTLFEDTVNRIQGELEAKELILSELQKKPEPESAPENPPTSESEWRRLWGMHRQLRDQFEEKSSQLDEARKALFHLQEEQAVQELELKEAELNFSPEVKYLTEKMNQLLDQLESREKEILRLEHIVSSFS